MEIGITLLVVSVLVVGIWIFIEIKRLRHKVFAMILIALILFTYLSFMATIKGQNLDLSTSEGLIKASKLYFVWLGNIFENIKTVTAQVINMDWTNTS